MVFHCLQISALMFNKYAFNLVLAVSYQDEAFNLHLNAFILDMHLI